MNRIPFAICLFAVLAGCASESSAPTSQPVPDKLRPAEGETLVSTVAARGVQIYECRAKKDDPAAAEWVFVAPEAGLYDMHGTPVGHHYAGPRWEHNDGSKIVGAVKERSDAPVPGAIPWLLLTTTSDGPTGLYTRVTSVQRIATVGGTAPVAGCSSAQIGQTARVPYQANYMP